MSIVGQGARKVSAPQTLTPQQAPAAHATGADVAGHGLLSRFHAGCRCGWCSSRAREDTCGCGPCRACRAHPYFTFLDRQQP